MDNWSCKKLIFKIAKLYYEADEESPSLEIRCLACTKNWTKNELREKESQSCRGDKFSLAVLIRAQESLGEAVFSQPAKEMNSKIIGRRFCCTASVQPWLFVGLGNPGDKYKGTRHNVGFEMIDAFADSLGISMNTVHCKALFGQGYVGHVPVLLAKPQTYMNLSGESAGPLAAYYHLPLDRVVVFHDDMTLQCGVLRLQQKGGHGSHIGKKTTQNISIDIDDQRLKNVIYHFHGNREFARLRIGIGRPPGQMDPKAFLLQKFNKVAQERIDTALKEGVAMLNRITCGGLAESAGCFNKEQKYKHILF